MAFVCPVHGYYVPEPGVTVAWCPVPTCARPPMAEEVPNGAHAISSVPPEIYAEVDRLRELLTALVESEDQPCRYDHHGYCQEHGWFGEPGECYTRFAREAVGLQ